MEVVHLWEVAVKTREEEVVHLAPVAEEAQGAVAAEEEAAAEREAAVVE